MDYILGSPVNLHFYRLCVNSDTMQKEFSSFSSINRWSVYSPQKANGCVPRLTLDMFAVATDTGCFCRVRLCRASDSSYREASPINISITYQELFDFVWIRAASTLMSVLNYNGEKKNKKKRIFNKKSVFCLLHLCNSNRNPSKPTLTKLLPRLNNKISLDQGLQEQQARENRFKNNPVTTLPKRKTKKSPNWLRVFCVHENGMKSGEKPE